MNLDELATATKEALGDQVSFVGTEPFDNSKKALDDIQVRIRMEDWVGLTDNLQTGEVEGFLVRITATIRARWARHNAESLRNDQCKTVVAEFADKGWAFRGLAFDEDDDLVFAVMEFVRVEEYF